MPSTSSRRRFHFREQHETIIAATPTRIYRAIRAVSADEIALFQTFTWIRRFGRSGPEGILNAPEHQPFSTSQPRPASCCCRINRQREVVIGAVVVAPPGHARPAIRR